MLTPSPLHDSHRPPSTLNEKCFGLYPLILETSFQAQFLIPMAISVAYGVLFGTIILLIYFPPLIVYFNDMKRTRRWIWEGGKTIPSWDKVEPVIENQKRVASFHE